MSLSNQLKLKIMKKNEPAGHFLLKKAFWKIFLFMKLTIVFIMLFSLQVTAKVRSQTKVTLKMQQASLSSILLAIEKKTDFRFLFSDDLMPDDKKIDINVKNALVTEVLDNLLNETRLGYKIVQDNLIVITNSTGLSRTVQLTGIVTNSNGGPIASASVLEKGTNNGTATGSDGRFQLTVTSLNATIVISFIGFESQEIPLNGNATISVELKEKTSQLNEVMVVGYGTQRRNEVTNAITNVKAEEFNKGNISNVAQLLQGKVAGLSISRPGNDPNSPSTLRLRGLSTLGLNAGPLVVVDGQIGADINTLDPNDIQSINVLKDGSAAAIYGTRGSAGVIIITSKSGSAGGPSLSYNVSGTTENPARFTAHMNADEYRKLGTGTDYGSTTDWNKEISRTAYSYVHNLSLAGGNKGTTYNASLNYRNNQGVALKTGNQQLNGHFNLRHKALNDKLVISLTLNSTRRQAQFGNAAAFKWATIYNPTAPVFSTDPLYDLAGGGYFESAGTLDYFNPVAALVLNTNEGETVRNNFGGTAEYEIIKGLKFLTRYAYQTSDYYGFSYSPRNSFSLGGFQRRGLANKREDKSFNELYENTLTYDTRFKDIEINLLGGYSYQSFTNKGFSVNAGDFLTDESKENINSALDFRNGLAISQSYKNASKLIAFFGRLNLNYKNLVFLQASLRREGSSMFGVNNQWGNFPSVSAGLDISRLVEIPKVDNLKVRASYGITGALPPSPYLSLERITNQGGSYYAGNGTYLQTYATFVNPNPDLKWERKAEFDIGLDFSLFDKRLNGSFDYYNRKTKDLIFNLFVPSPPNLNPNTWKNIGEIKNNGIEITLGYDVIRKKNFTWNTSANYSTYNIILSKLDESLEGSFVGASTLGSPGFSGLQVTRAVAGQPIGLLWGLRYLGLDASGKYLFDDGSGKPVGFANAKEMVIGNGLPDFEFGWSNTFKYKNFDLNFFLRGSIGHDLINTYRAFYETPSLIGYNIVNTKYFDPALKDGKKFSSLEVEKASFVRLDNATLGYNFALPQSKAFKTLRVYFTGQNLFTITDYTGVDPEVRYTDVDENGSTNVLAPGVDRRETWIYSRSFTLGVNFGF